MLLLLAFAGMLRPEAWFLAAMYFVLGGVARDVARAVHLRGARGARPADLGAVDFLVTGNPLFSQHYTSPAPRTSAASAR